jgi:methionyl-tRNA synthetase
MTLNLFQSSIALSPLALGMSIFFGVVFLLVIVALKGYSLWYSARNGQRIWFIILLIVNTFGILEVIYLVWVAKKVKRSSVPAQAPASTPAPLN